MRLFEDDAEFFSDAKPTSSLPVSHHSTTETLPDEHNGGESLKRSEATGKGLSSIVEESPALATESHGPSFLAKLLTLLIPMLLFVGYYGYSQVKGATARPGAATMNLGTVRTLDDPTNSVGNFTDIAIGSDGYPVISYQDATAQALKFYKCDNTTCSTGTARTLEDVVNLVGAYIDVAIGSDGYPVISYQDQTNFALKFYKCDNVACSSGTASTLEDVANWVGFYADIAIGSDGYPVISYQDFTAGALKLYKCDNVACSSGTARTLEDVVNNVGYETSITIGSDGYPVISYQNGTTQALKLYKCDNVACSSGTARTLEDSGDSLGYYTSIAIGTDGYPVISYLNITTFALKLYKCDNVACSSGTARTLEDLANQVGVYTSITIGADGYPVISHLDNTDGALKLYKCDNAVCSSGISQTLDGSANEVGHYTSITIGTDGYPVISYQDNTIGTLKFARVPSREVTINTTASSTGSLGTGLVGHWTFDGPDLTTAIATDKSGRGNNGVLTNGPLPVIGKIGQGLSFDGIDDKLVLGNSISESISSELTVCLWVNIKEWSTVATDQEKLIQAGDDQNTSNFIFNFDNALSDSGTHRDLSFQSESASKVIYSGTGSLIDLNEWNHLCVSHTNTDQTTFMYVNGGRVLTTGSTGLLSGDSIGTVIGSRISGAAGDDVSKGDFDDVRIYNRILTADEIADLYTGTTGSTAGICGTGGVRDADGNTYGIVQIGTQCWLDRNMNVGTRVNAATTQTNNGTIEKYCYDDTASNCTDNHPKRPDGGLYQWNEAMQYSTTEGAQGICPSGWHIPTHDEFTSLERTVCTSSSCATDFPYDTTTTGARGTDEGTKLKPNGTSLWEGNLTGNSFGPGFSDRSFEGYYWSSSQNGTSGRVRQLSSGSLQVIRGSVLKTIGFSVRCIKD